MKRDTGVVLVHGAWHTPSHFDNVISELESRDYQVAAPQLASSSHTALEDAFDQDVAIVKAAIKEVAASNKNVVVVMHSYGGMCGSDAVAQFIEESKAAPQEGAGKVSRLFYISALIVPKGTNLLEDGNTKHVLHMQDGLLHNLEPYYRFYHTTALNVAFEAMRRLNPQNLSSFATPTSYQGWSAYGVPVTYIACKQDRALCYDPDLLKFSQRLREAGVDPTIHTMDCDHSPWLSAEAEFMGYLHLALI